MEVKEAIKKAKEYIQETFAGENYTNFGFEEVVYDYDSNEWRITFGFSRPWDRPQTENRGHLEALLGYRDREYRNREAELLVRRSYKLVTMSDDGAKISVKNREV